MHCCSQRLLSVSQKRAAIVAECTALGMLSQLLQLIRSCAAMAAVSLCALRKEKAIWSTLRQFILRGSDLLYAGYPFSSISKRSQGCVPEVWIMTCKAQLLHFSIINMWWPREQCFIKTPGLQKPLEHLEYFFGCGIWKLYKLFSNISVVLVINYDAILYCMSDWLICSLHR